MAFNLVFNVVTVKAAATAYGIANMFTFSTNRVLENFNNIAESDSDRVVEFVELGEQMPAKLMLVVAKFRPMIKDLVFKKPDIIDTFIDTKLFDHGIALAKKSEDFGLPDLTEEMNDKEIGVWMQVFMSSKEKVKSIAEPLSDWSKQAQEYFEIKL